MFFEFSHLPGINLFIREKKISSSSNFQAVLHDHDICRISSLTKDETDPRALAYVYQNEDSYCLFYIKMANMVRPLCHTTEKSDVRRK